MECPALFSDGYFSMEKRDLEVQNYYYDAPTSISREALQSRATTSENFDMQVIFLLVQRSTLYSILYNRNFYLFLVFLINLILIIDQTTRQRKQNIRNIIGQHLSHRSKVSF